MGFNKDIGSVFMNKTKNKKNEKKQKQQRLTFETNDMSSSTVETKKKNLTDFVRDNFTKLYSISRGEMLTPTATHNKPMRINSLETCCENYCIIPGLKSPHLATGRPLPIPDERAFQFEDDNISVNSSVPLIDFDSISLSGQSSNVDKINNTAGCGNKIPSRLTYAFASDREREDHISEKLFSYCSSKQTKTPSATSLDASKQSCKVIVESKGETMEEVIKNIRKYRAEWTNDGVQIVEPRVRRKILEGSYPNFTVIKENELPSLLRFVWKGKVNKLKKYLQDESKHHKINRQDTLGRTALHFAASWGDDKVMKLLLKVPGIKLNMKDGNDMTPLFKAVEMKSLPFVKLLVEAGAKARISCRDNRTLVEYAITEFGDECFSLVEYLYRERGLRDVRYAEDHMTLLHQTILVRSHVSVTKTIEMMIECNADIDAVEGNGRSPLILANIANRADIVYVLLRNFADVDIYDSFMTNAIRYAKKGSECYKLLRNCHRTRTRVLQPINLPQYNQQYQHLSNALIRDAE